MMVKLCAFPVSSCISAIRPGARLGSYHAYGGAVPYLNLARVPAVLQYAFYGTAVPKLGTQLSSSPFFCSDRYLNLVVGTLYPDTKISTRTSRILCSCRY
eukprot:SAG31_NODE_698_length_12746_cov_3.495136_8_plen_100_part_00